MNDKIKILGFMFFVISLFIIVLFGVYLYRQNVSRKNVNYIISKHTNYKKIETVFFTPACFYPDWNSKYSYYYKVTLDNDNVLYVKFKFGEYSEGY